MVLIRFMGIQEMEKYLAGDVLRNETNWKGISRSTSVGFCFFPAEPEPESRLHYISGVVNFNVVAEFETVGPIILRKRIGEYRDPKHDNPISLHETLFTKPKMMEVDEFSVTEYSKQTLRLIRLGTVILGMDFDWHLIWIWENR